MSLCLYVSLSTLRRRRHRRLRPPRRPSHPPAFISSLLFSVFSFFFLFYPSYSSSSSPSSCPTIDFSGALPERSTIRGAPCHFSARLMHGSALALALLLALWCPILISAQFQVLYRENSEHIWNSSEPVRFWELVEYRPTTPPPPPPPTTTTEATTTTPTTTTTEDPCESSHPLDLTRRLRDTEGYNKIYMAKDFSTARNEFPDLRGLAHKPANDYHCGKRCQRSSQLIRKIIKTGQPAEAERAWWDEEEWEERAKRAADWREIEDKSSATLMRNTGTSRHILGMTVAVECDDENGEFNSGGYSLCTTCRAVRHLPSTYFPRVVNELICSQKACLRGEGKCIQRVMPMKVLRNVGTRECARWQMSSIDVRTCCDCMLNPSSPLVTYL